jgi:hypothetical protein
LIPEVAMTKWNADGYDRMAAPQAAMAEEAFSLPHLREQKA